MKDSITVNIDELIDTLESLKNKWNSNYAELLILDSEEDDGDIIPATLEISGFNSNEPNVHVGADSIEEVVFD